MLSLSYSRSDHTSSLVSVRETPDHEGRSVLPTLHKTHQSRAVVGGVVQLCRFGLTKTAAILKSVFIGASLVQSGILMSLRILVS